MGITRSGLPLSLLFPLSALSVPALAPVLAGCSIGEDRHTIDVFAASSLTDAYGVLEERFEAERPDIDIRLNLAGSATLLRQILDGADADVYAPADVDLIEGVSELIVGDAPVYASNALTLVVPIDSDSDADAPQGRGIDSPDDLAAEGTLVARCAPGVPCGDATDRYLDANDLQLAIATEEVNVRSVLLKVATGEVDAGFVYTTDALARSEEVRVIPLSDAPRVELAIARLSDDPAATDFASFVTSPAGAEVFRSFGFETQ